jgi:hypothetical protein
LRTKIDFQDSTREALDISETPDPDLTLSKDMNWTLAAHRMPPIDSGRSTQSSSREKKLRIARPGKVGISTPADK